MSFVFPAAVVSGLQMLDYCAWWWLAYWYGRTVKWSKQLYVHQLLIDEAPGNSLWGVERNFSVGPRLDLARVMGGGAGTWGADLKEA